MAHFAKLDSNNQVISVEVVDNQWILDENEQESEQVGIDFLHTVHNNEDIYVQTSYNGSFRCRFAATGYSYNEEFDVFIRPKPFDSWILNEDTYDWDPPVPMPDDGKPYKWNEETQSWDLIQEESNP